MITNTYKVTISLAFEVEATSEEVAREMAHERALNEWIPAVLQLKEGNIEIKEF